MFVLEEIQLSVPKKSNCVKANYLGGPALISHLKMPFVSRLVFLRLSLSNKKYIIKFKCHDIQSTDSGLGPISTLGNSEFRKRKTKDFHSENDNINDGGNTALCVCGGSRQCLKGF